MSSKTKYIPSSIDIKIKASHYDFINENAFLYTSNAVSKGLDSWTKPYKKPQLVGHDKTRDPLGRIIDAKLVKTKNTAEPPNYVQLTARITDKDAIEKILDGRFSTVSVGSRAKKVICSECLTVLTHQGLCEHKKGSIGEDGKTVYWIIDELEYIESSFVNEPADKYTGIEEIDVGKGFITYNDFLDNKDAILAEFLMEDNMSIKDARLTAAQRNQLPEGAFCGPGRSFPAHDKAHVVAGLRLLSKSEFSDSTKEKIKSCLYRKGQKYGVTPTEDELQKTPDLLTFRMDDNFSEEELTKISDFFKANPDSDLPEIEDDSKTSSTPEVPNELVDTEKLKKEELKDLVLSLQKQLQDQAEVHKKAIEEKDIKINSLETEIKDSKILILQKDEELYKNLDDIAKLDQKFKDAIISNIIDLKLTDNNNEARKEIQTKLSQRKIESLLDSLEDIRIVKTTVDVSLVNPKIQDPTLTTNNSDKEIKDQNNKEKIEDSKFSLFDRDRTSMEVKS